MTCILLGTSDFAIPSAEVLMENSACSLVGIITTPSKPAGRGNALRDPPLLTWAREHGARMWQPATKEALRQLLGEFHPDIAVVVAYGTLIPKTALDIPRFGFLNVHPSLLSRWRGPSPIAAAIAAGDLETGVTIMLLDEQTDHGPILAQERIPLSPTATRSSLEQELASRCAALLRRTLPRYVAGDITLQPQNDALATICPLLSRESGRLDWSLPAAVLERRIRAYDGWPGTWCVLPNGKRLKIHRAVIGEHTISPAGTVERGASRFNVACGDGKLLTLTAVQLEAGSAMDGPSFLRGRPSLGMLT